jgi:hypothetical protein
MSRPDDDHARRRDVLKFMAPLLVVLGLVVAAFLFLVFMELCSPDLLPGAVRSEVHSVGAVADA